MLCSHEITKLYWTTQFRVEDISFLCQRDTCSTLINEWHPQFIEMSFTSGYEISRR